MPIVPESYSIALARAWPIGGTFLVGVPPSTGTEPSVVIKCG